jgi:hypothetical protein
MYTWGPIQRSAVTPSGPTPWLLDTFTGADGSASGTADIMPSPFEWHPETGQTGEIQDNAFVVKSGQTRALMFAYPEPDETAETTITLPIFLLVFADTGPDPGGGAGHIIAAASAYNFYPSWMGMNIYCNGQVYVDCAGDFDYWDGYHTVGTGLNKIGMYADASTFRLIANGAVIAESTRTDPFAIMNSIKLEISPDGTSPLTGYVDKIAIYQDITLADAIALTA